MLKRKEKKKRSSRKEEEVGGFFFSCLDFGNLTLVIHDVWSARSPVTESAKLELVVMSMNPSAFIDNT